MKKNISINISGIIFHIEEDGYETLKKYLDSINRYFSNFEDSSEILADIESRIAEIFLSKLNEEKQVITLDDVNSLVSTMGSVSDFKAAEDTEETKADASSSTQNAQTSGFATEEPRSNTAYTPPRDLRRDQKRKVLGGVCSGIANYFNVDPLWIRLIFALLTFAYGITFFIYVIMWILVPGSYDLDEPYVGKKMYRDPERKVIGGVAGGAAAYLGVDILAIRIVFILLAFAGLLGVFIYIVMWIALPEARSLTDKMQMQGEAVTLSNIESTIKKSQTDRTANESALTKILLFPFRLIGIILNALAKLVRPLLDVARVLVGVFIVLMGIMLVFSVVVTGGLLIGIFSTAALSLPWMAELNETSVPVDAFLRAFPGWIALAGFFASIIPSIFIVLLGVSIIAKRVVFNATTGWTMFALFFVSLAMLAVGIPKIVFAFREEGEYKVEQTYRPTGKTVVLRVNETGMDDYHGIKIDLAGHAQPDFKLVQTFKSQGSSRAKAIENAKMIDYTVVFQDSVFTFDSNVDFKPGAVFRGQELRMTLFVPYNFPFIIEKEISRRIRDYIDWEFEDGQTWKMTEKGLECITCPVREEDEEMTDLTDFDELEINGKFDVHLIRSDGYAVEVSGSERAKNNYNIYKRGETLVIDYKDQDEENWNFENLRLEEVEINISLPQIESIEAIGVGSIRLDDFQSDELNIDLRGPVNVKGELQTQKLNVALSASASADISGHASNMIARLEFASKLRAYNLEVNDAFVETSGASTAKINVTGTLEMETGSASKIDYRGNPQIIKRD